MLLKRPDKVLKQSIKQVVCEPMGEKWRSLVASVNLLKTNAASNM